MSIYYPSSNCGGGAIPRYACNPCPTYEYSRIRSIAFVRNTVSFVNPASPAEWSTQINNLNAIVIWATSGTYDGGTVEELVGFGDSEFYNGAITHTLTYKDPNTVENCDFYNAIKDSTDYTVYFRTSSRLWSAGRPVTITPKMPVADDLKAVLTYEVTVKWSSPSLPCSFAVPDNIFNQCYIKL